MAKKKELTTEQIKAKYHRENKELMYLLYYFFSNNKTESFIFANLNNVTDNVNSLKASASQYSKSIKVANIEPTVNIQIEMACKRFLSNAGYTISKDGNENTNTEQNTTDTTSRTNEIETTNTDKEKNKESRKEVVSKIDFSENNLLPEDFDLSNKDMLYKEMNRLYRLADSSKERIDIAKLISNVEDMKNKRVEEDEQQIIYYFPLRQCEDCPNNKRFTKDGNEVL